MARIVFILAFVAGTALTGTAARAHGPQRLPLGDGHLGTTPHRGTLMACVQPRGDARAGAFRSGDWIEGDTWRPDGKPHVEGDVAWPQARVRIAREGAWRVVRANGLPLHATGIFPIQPGTAAYAYDRNPNRIGERELVLRLPATPSKAAAPSCVPMGLVGFTTSGVALFNAVDLAGRDAPAHEIQDRCNGHPEVSDQYHYHNWSPCLARRDPEEPVGWMLDGFPILGPVDAKGHTYVDADLDACHGTTGPVRIDGKRVTRYHYRFTLEFPYTIGCFTGTPVRVAGARPR